MRKIAGVLFAVGIPWSLIAWIAVFGGPAGAISDLVEALRHRERLFGAIVQVPAMLLLSANAAFGYAMWARWLLIAMSKHTASRQFWCLAATHHLIWAIFGHGINCSFNLISLYSILLFGICVAAAITTRGRDITRSSLASI